MSRILPGRAGLPIGRRSSAIPLALCFCFWLLPLAQAQPDALQVSVDFQGINDGGLAGEMRALSELATGDEAYSSLTVIRRQGARDVTRILEALTSKGFYEAQAEPIYRRVGETVEVSFNIAPGKMFRISRYVIQYDDKADESRPATFAGAEIETSGDPSGEALQELDEAIVEYLRGAGYPVAKSKTHFVQANFNKGTAIAVFVLESGPKALFGNLVISGTEKTKPDFIEQYVTWEAGTLYQRQKLVKYREALIKTGLFGEISVNPGTPEADGNTDILVSVSERKRRSVGAGVSFATDIGAGGQVFWENRNAFGRAEKISTRLKLSDPEQDIELNISRPLPGLPGAFTGAVIAKNEISDAFEAQSVEASAALSRFWFDRKLELRGGLGLNYSQIDDAGIQDEFFYVTAPGTISWNSDDDLLNPTSGFRANLTVTPFVGDVNFVQAKLAGATRRAFGRGRKFILAARGAIGSSFGIDRDSIPATERFFAGGGGTVRGFAFQEAGPLDANLDPIGGASVLEVNLEARYQLREKLQMAVFIDAGTVSENDLPNFSEEAFVGAGVGFRYLTLVGPLRLDIATPLNPRETDDPFQLYIALGQPF